MTKEGETPKTINSFNFNFLGKMLSALLDIIHSLK